jgi:hypothetical protein
MNHPDSDCPYCGAVKPGVAWRVCSQFCDDYSQAQGIYYAGKQPESEFEMKEKRKQFLENK